MATLEDRTDERDRVVSDDRAHLIHSWSVQSALAPLAVAGAEGRYFWDYDGKRYLDFASQLVNVSIGHQHPQVVAAIKDQADLLCTIGPPMANDKRSEAARLIAEVMPGDLDRTFFTNGGAEANENAIRLARWVTGRHKIVARYRSYHGATGGAITLTGDPRRWFAEPGIPGVVRMLDPYTYRCPAGHPDPCPVCSGGPHLEEILEYEGAHTVAAVILETIVGHERDHRPAGRLPAVDPRGVRPPRDPADPRRGDGGLGPHRPLVRVRALGRRPGHHHDRQGHQLRLRPARRDDRARPRLRRDQGPLLRRRPHVLAATRSPAPPPSRRSRRSRTRASSSTRPPWATSSPRSCRSSPSATRRSATCAA